jgi:PHD/YefM family antitoxin component YafN of YafNO toxin-antitoxin module
MRTVNALTLRNRLGQVLDTLKRTGRPILVSKGREIRAVLITPEDFQRRFLDVQAAEERAKLLRSIKNVSAAKTEPTSSLDVLRHLRGYRA